MKFENLLANNKNYRIFWLTNIVTFFVLWMQSTLAAIAITELSSSVFLSSLSHWASTMPIFLFGIIAGIIGDKYNKFIVMSIASLLMSVAMVFLSIASSLQVLNPTSIIICTFLFAIGSSLRMPSAQSVTSELVDKNQIRNAAVLNNISFNLMRTAGPSLAGVIIVFCSLSQSFLIVAVISFLSAIAFYLQRDNIVLSHNYKLSISFKKIIQIGFKSQVFRVVLFDTVIVFGCGSIMWALLPYLAKYSLHMDSIGQGGLISLIGVGAIISGLLFSRIIHKVTINTTMSLIYIIMITSLVVITITLNKTLIYISLIMFGFAWASAVSNLNGMVQISFYKNIISRITSIYIMLMYATQAISSVIFGYLGTVFSLQKAFFIAASILSISLIIRKILIEKIMVRK